MSAGNAHKTPPLGTSSQASNAIEAPVSNSPKAAAVRSSTRIQAVPNTAAAAASRVSRADLVEAGALCSASLGVVFF
jgi:hypothetical protein